MPVAESRLHDAEPSTVVGEFFSDGITAPLSRPTHFPVTCTVHEGHDGSAAQPSDFRYLKHMCCGLFTVVSVVIMI